MEVFYMYSRKRRDFGKQTHFSDSKPQAVVSIPQVTYETLTLDTLDFKTKPLSNHSNDASSDSTAPSSPNQPIRSSAPKVVNFYGANAYAENNDANLRAAFPAEKCAFVESFVTTTSLDCTPIYGETEVNTESVELSSKGVSHVEGAWPKEVDPKYIDSVMRYKRKIEKSPQFAEFVQRSTDNSRRVVDMNNVIDLFEQYFQHQPMHYFYTQPTAKIVKNFRDPALRKQSAANSHAMQQQSGSGQSVPQVTTVASVSGKNSSQDEIKRVASSITWHPEKLKFAAAYCTLDFGRNPSLKNLESYIWDIQNTSVPEMELIPSSPLVCLEYNPRDSFLLVGGSYNGLVSLWDTRLGSNPAVTSIIETSHSEPVYEINWTTSKTGMECASVSTDGSILYWDCRRMVEPLDVVKLYAPSNAAQSAPTTSVLHHATPLPPSVLCGTCISYNMNAGSNKLLVGTEQGFIYNTNRKPIGGSAAAAAASVSIMSPTLPSSPLSTSTPAPGTSAKPVKKDDGGHITMSFEGHHGPVHSLARHPVHAKYFLSIGDWCARLWSDDVDRAILATSYHSAPLTGGCWSPTKSNVFFTIDRSGMLDCFDLLSRAHEPVARTKVSQAPLRSIRVERNEGSLVAIGDRDGSITLLSLSSNLYAAQPGERNMVGEMMEKETKATKCAQHFDKLATKSKWNNEARQAKDGQQQQQPQHAEESKRKEEQDSFNRIFGSPSTNTASSTVAATVAVPPPASLAPGRKHYDFASGTNALLLDAALKEVDLNYHTATHAPKAPTP